MQGNYLPINWQRLQVQDIISPIKSSLVSGPFGSNIGKRFFVEEGIPLIRGNNLTLGVKKFIDEGFVYITEEKAYELRNCKAIPGDIIFTAAGTLGQVGIIPQNSNYPKYIISNKQLRLRCDTDIALPEYLYYWFSSSKIREYIINQNTGASVPLITLGILRSLPVNLPPLPTQRKIAAILSVYDDLIENNTRRIAILEEMAQSLYREWFVHFRFPGHEKKRLVESGLGLIPEGWEVKALEYFGTIVTGKTPSKLVPEYFGEEYMPFVKTPDLHGNMFCIRIEEYLSEQGAWSQKNKTIPPNSLCVNCIGARAGSVSITIFRSQTNQQINSIILSEAYFREFLYFVLLDLKETIHQYGSNGATMVNLNKAKFGALRVIYPLSSIVAEFHGITYPMFEEIKSLELQNANLRKTRDLLLPKLISGEVDVEKLSIAVGK
jgi:type I restriction enzyme, S subunit